MKQSVFNLNVAHARLDRNAFDLSHSDVFSCAPGQLLPISVSEVNPNEHFEIRPEIFLRTMPLNSAAYVRMRQHVEFFFVPMRVLCRQLNQFVVGTKYPISALDTLNEFNNHLPHTALSTLRSICTISSGLVHSDGLGIGNEYNYRRLLDLLGYGINCINYPYTATTDTDGSLDVQLFRLAAYQKIYMDFYRNPYYEPVDTLAFNLDDEFGLLLGTSTADTDRLKKLCTLRYRNWKQDYFTSVQPQFQGAPFVTRNVDMANFSIEDFNNPSMVPFQTSSFTLSSGDAPTESQGSSVGFNEDVIGTISDVNTINIPVHNIRAAFALDKLLRLQQQAGNGSYGEQVRNRFGSAGVHDDWKAVYLGGSSAPVSISEVITTANTDSRDADSTTLGRTGDIFGKAMSASDPLS